MLNLHYACCVLIGVGQEDLDEDADDRHGSECVEQVVRFFASAHDAEWVVWIDLDLRQLELMGCKKASLHIELLFVKSSILNFQLFKRLSLSF
jgi:hypothetical protein